MHSNPTVKATVLFRSPAECIFIKRQIAARRPAVHKRITRRRGCDDWTYKAMRINPASGARLSHPHNPLNWVLVCGGFIRFFPTSHIPYNVQYPMYFPQCSPLNDARSHSGLPMLMQVQYLDHATMIHVYVGARSSKLQLAAVYPFARRNSDFGI